MIIENIKTKARYEVTEEGWETLRANREHVKYRIISRNPTMQEAGQKVQMPPKVEAITDAEAFRVKFQNEIVAKQNELPKTRTKPKQK